MFTCNFVLRHINKCPGFRVTKHSAVHTDFTRGWWMLSTSQSPSSDGEARCSHQTLRPSQGGALQLHIHNPRERSAPFTQLFNRFMVHKLCFSTGPGAGGHTNVHTWSWHQFFSNFPRQEWAIKKWPGRLVGKWSCKTFEINLPIDLCSSSMGTLQPRLTMASDTHRKFWTRCPEVQLTAGQSSKLGQVAQAFAN